MIRQIIHIDEEKCNGCGLLKPAMKVQLPLLMAKQNLSAMIIVTAWGIAFQTALPEQYLLKPGKLRLMMRPL